MLIICIIRFAEPLAFTSIFPYIYFMIRDFQISKHEQDISQYSGYIASSFAFCQFLFAIHWGKMSDKLGRKPILIIGLLGTSISLLLFGFATNYYWALFARCLAGILNGNVAVLRTMIGEIAVEKRHQPLAFLTMPLLFNFGAIIGPAIGGSTYLTKPKEKSPYDNDNDNNIYWMDNWDIYQIYQRFLNKFPYALPNIVVSLIIWFSLSCGILFLEETHEIHKYRRDYGVDLGDWLLNKIGISIPTRPWHNCNQIIYDNDNININETTTLLQEIEGEDVFPEANPDPDPNPDPESILSPQPPPPPPQENNDGESQPLIKSKSIVFTPKVIGVIIGNFIISLHSVTYNEFLPIFLASRFQPQSLKFPFQIVGGMELNINYIGTLFSSTGIMGILIVLILFPLIDCKLGTIGGYRLSVSIFPLIYLIIPLTIFTLHQYNHWFPLWITPSLLYLLTSLKTLASSTGMPQITILNHRVAAKQHRAYVNGASMSFVSLSRFCGPMIFGYLMSLGEKYQIGWLIWWIMSGLAVIGMIQSYWIEEEEDDEDDESD